MTKVSELTGIAIDELLGAYNAAVRTLPTPVFNVKGYGAAGDGSADDTVKIQNAIDAAAEAGGGLVFFPRGIYKLTKQGAKPYTLTGATISHQYCLKVPSNVVLWLCGSTLRLGPGQNASLIINDSLLYTDIPNSRIAIYDGVFDCDQANQTSPPQSTMAAVYLVNVSHVVIRDIRFENVRDSALIVQKADSCHFDNLHCSWSDGDAFEFGKWYGATAPFDARIKRCTIGSLRAENCQNALYGTRQGNPVIITAQDCALNQAVAYSCGGGFKIQNGSERVTIGRVEWLGSTSPNANNSTRNSGVKVQGADLPEGKPVDISIGQIVCSLAKGNGLYVDDANDVSIGSYIGCGNSTGGTDPDVWLGKSSRCHIGFIDSQDGGQVGVLVRSDASDYQIGELQVNNPGKATGGSDGVQIVGGSGTIRVLTARDDQTSHTMTTGLNVAVNTAKGAVDRLEATGYKNYALLMMSAQYTVREVIWQDGAPLYGEVTLSPGTTTAVSNANAVKIDLGANGWMYPIIELVPKNASGMALTRRVEPYSWPLLGFYIYHSSAAGTEKFSWRIVGWVNQASRPA